MGTLQNNDQQARNHVKAGHQNHQQQNDPHIHIEQVQPVENMRKLPLDVDHPQQRFVIGQVGQKQVAHLVFHDVHLIQIIDENFEPADLVFLPRVQALKMPDVNQHKHLVELFQPGTVNAANLKLPDAGCSFIFIQKIHAKRVAKGQFQEVRHLFRNPHLAGSQRIERNLFPGYFVFFEEGPVKIRSNPFQHHTLNGFFGTNHARLGNKLLHMFYLGHGSQLVQKRLPAVDQLGLIGKVAVVIHNLQVCGKAIYFVFNLALKTGHNCHGQNHHHHAQADASYRQANNAPRHFLASVFR